MVINDVPIVSNSLRLLLNDIIESEFASIEKIVNRLLSYPPGDYASTFDYHNLYQPGKNNIIYDHNGIPLMCVFEFSPKNRVKIYRALGLSNLRPNINAIRVYPNTIIPMHIDLNKGNIGRQYPIYSIVTSGETGIVYISNSTDGSKQVAIPGLTQFIMCPDSIAHGAKSGADPYTLLQIQLTGENFKHA